MPMPPEPEFLALQAVVTGRYSLERELGRGGMGIVFLARDVRLDRPVAIKMLPPALATRRDLRALFIQEARTAAKLSHPHIVPIHAVEEHGEIVFFVMTFVDGETLGQRVRRAGPLAPGEVMRVMQEVAWALGHAHARGVVHRDVKPDNILLDGETGRAFVTDFGIAQIIQSGDPGAELPAGTPRYMSPEQASGATVDARSDLYALGATAFYAASGHAPFEADTVAALILKHAHEPAPLLGSRAPHLPPSFAAAVNRLLAKNPGDRFTTADEFAEVVRAARGAIGSVPALVRRYVLDSEQVMSEVTTLVGTTGVAVVGFEVVKLLSGDFLGIISSIEVVIASVLLAISGTMIGRLVHQTRQLIRRGYGHDAVRAAVVVADRTRDLERAVTSPSGPTARTWITAAVALGVSTLGFYLMTGGYSEAVSVIGWLVGITTPVVATRRVWRDLQASKRGSFWNRLLGGRLGRWLFRGAGLGVARNPAAVSADPTAVVLGRATEDLLQSLPAEQRRRLGDVPALVARLQEDVAALSTRDVTDPARGSRLEAAVAALENLRLDLLRLHAGHASVDDLTADIARAMHIGLEVDAVAEANWIAGDGPVAETT